MFGEVSERVGPLFSGFYRYEWIFSFYNTRISGLLGGFQVCVKARSPGRVFGRVGL